MTRLLSELGRHIDYQFNRHQLLECALTHRSAGGRNNERLEFLGDSILNFIVAAELYRQFPQAKEGELSRYRANLVNGVILAELARIYELGEFLRLGQGELKSGGCRRDSILADALEAVIGAIYLDGGLEQAQRFVVTLYQDRLKSISTDENFKDPKTRLQEYLQAKKFPIPEYSVVSVEGHAHAQLFKVACQVRMLKEVTTGAGSSRRRAEQAAAQEALRILEQDG